MKKTDYTLLLGWEGPSVNDMLVEFVEDYSDSLNDYWEVFAGVCIDMYDVSFDRELVEKKCVSFGIPYVLVQYIIFDSYVNNCFEWLLLDENNIPFKGSLEFGIAKKIKIIADEWLDDPDKMYKKLYEQLN